MTFLADTTQGSLPQALKFRRIMTRIMYQIPKDMDAFTLPPAARNTQHWTIWAVRVVSKMIA